MTLAWTTAYLTRVERLPDLGSMLRRIRGVGPSDADVIETKRVAEEGLKRLEAARGRKRTKQTEKTEKTEKT